MLANVTAEVAAPLQSVWLTGVVTVGVGFTVMVNVCVAPVQPIADGVTVTTPAIGAALLLVAVNAAMLPVPDEARPIAVFVLAQV